MSETALLTIENLTVALPDWADRPHAVDNLNLSIGRNEFLCVVGESGSGKSVMSKAILRLLPEPHLRVTAGRIHFEGQDLLALRDDAMRAIRGGRIAMVLQDPKFSLDPVMRIGAQIEETLRAHVPVSAGQRRERMLQALADTGIEDPARVARLYPHEVSGGMGQRAMIAMMLVAGPELLIADEPTSALDVTVQLQVLGVLDRLVRDKGMGLVFVSHDLRLVASFCDRVLVMYAGRVVEEIAATELHRAQHPYTQGLLNCLPQLGAPKHPLPVLDRRPEWLNA